MKTTLGRLRVLVREELARASSRFAPTDPDARVPGHLPDELPPSAALDEETWFPGHWMPNYDDMPPEDVERVGQPLGEPDPVDETDDRMVGDGKGNGLPDPNEGGIDDIAGHLKGDEDKIALGDPPLDEVVEAAWLNREIKRYLLQEGPAGAGMVDPTDVHGFYTPFDMEKDHMGTDDLSATWYKSPGWEPGGDGDPYRGPDPYAQMGFHPPAGLDDPTTTPPGVSGEEGFAALRAPVDWTLGIGGDTTKIGGVEAPGPEVGEEGESEEEGEEAGGPKEPGAEEEGAEREEQG